MQTPAPVVPQEASATELPSFLTSAAFWAAVGGAASTVCGALGYAHEGAAVSAALVAIGGVFIAIGGGFVVRTQQAVKLARKLARLGLR